MKLANRCLKSVKRSAHLKLYFLKAKRILIQIENNKIWVYCIEIHNISNLIVALMISQITKQVVIHLDLIKRSKILWISKISLLMLRERWVGVVLKWRTANRWHSQVRILNFSSSASLKGIKTTARVKKAKEKCSNNDTV